MLLFFIHFVSALPLTRGESHRKMCRDVGGTDISLNSNEEELRGGRDTPKSCSCGL